MAINLRSAVRHIDRAGALLVFPLKNRKEPASLWSAFYPRSTMRWEWNEDGDDRVADLWHLMKCLSESGQVVYSKWYQGRATFFSRDLFTAMLCLTRAPESGASDLGSTARHLLDVLEEDSPLSTKTLKAATDLQGRFHEGEYNRGMKELFRKLLIVGFGEVADGAFPSLAVGATRLMFEELWDAARTLDEVKAQRTVEVFLKPASAFRKAFDKTRA